jgi:hypothetical protein
MADQPQSLSVPAAAPPAVRARNPLGRSTWRSPPFAAWVRTRWVKRGLMTLTLLGLVAAFGWLVFRPLYHPNAQMAFLSGTDYHPLQAPPAAFALEDFEAMKGRDGITPFLARQGSEIGPLAWKYMQSPATMGSLGSAIADATPDGSGVMMIYVDAHGVSDDGVPYLLCRNFDPANPAAGRYPLRDLLAQFSASTASVKLLILDAGRIPCDPRLGMLVNEFPRLLGREVERTRDPKLWVLSSNAPFQRSHVSTALERSVFGFFVVRGLRGAADLNDDHNIDLDELFRYVATNTAAWVREASGGRETQTPVLLWGGGPDWSRIEPTVLLPAPYDVAGNVHSPTGSSQSAAADANSPYADEVHRELSPLAKVASKQATKKVPGAKAAKRTVKTGKKVSKELQTPDQKRAAGAKHVASESPPAANAEQPPAPAGEATPAEINPAEKKPGDGKSADTGNADERRAGSEKGTETTGEKPNATASDSKGKTEPSRSATTPAGPTDPATQAAQMLLDGWKWRDKSEAADDQPRPLDYAPQEWHEFQSRLLAEEQLDMAGGFSDPKAIANRVNHLLARLAKLPHVPPLDDDKPADLATKIAAMAPRLPSGVDSPTSLAMAQMFAERGGEPLDAEVASALQAIDRFSREGTLAELTAWTAKLNPRLDRFAEVRLARELSGASGLDWPSVQLALSAERWGQQVVAIDPALLPWVHHRVETADRLRLAGERTLQDGIETDRGDRGGSLLRQAIDLYQQAADDAAVVGGALQLQNDLLNRAPYYVAWYDPIVLTPSPDTPRPAELLELFDRLAALSAALDSADPSRLDQIRNLAAELTPLLEQVESGLGEITVGALVSRGPTGRVGRIEALLSTPLPDAEIRSRLLMALSDADTRLAKSYPPAHVPATIEPPPEITPQQWRQVESRAKLELTLAKLATGRNGNEDLTAANPLEEAYNTLHAAIEKVVASSTGPPESSDGSTEGERADAKAAGAAETGPNAVDAAWSAVGRFGAAVRDFDRGLAGQIETAVEANSDLSVRATRPTRLQAIRQSIRALRLIDSRDVKQMGEVDPISVLNDAELFDLLAWQQQRLEAAAADAPAGDADYLANAARSYRLQAEQIPRQPPLQLLGVVPLQMIGPTTVSLTTEPEQTIDVSVRRTGADPAPVWLMVDYDPDMLEVQLPSKPVIYQQPELRSEPRASGPAADEQLPLRPDRLGLASSLTLHPGDSEPLRLKIRAKPGARQSTRLIVKAISADAYLRHEIEVILPPAETLELTVEGTAGSWTPSETRVQLHPFPNRKTTYRLGLVNRGLTDRIVDVQLLSAEHPPIALPPATAVSAADAPKVLSRFGATAPVASLEKIAVPAGGRTVALPFPPPPKTPGEKKPDEPAPPPANGDEGATPGDAKAAPPPLPPLKTPLEHGLVAMISDHQTHLTTVRWIDIAPQRPRRYVHPQVAYDFDAGRLRIRVQPQDKTLLPPGTVHVHADLLPAPPAGTQTRLDGDLTAPDFEANLYADIVPDPGKTLTVRISVDGYPRAFVYRVPIGIESPDVPESLDLREVRILLPLSGAAYKAPIDSIPVDFEVDSPLGAFDNPDDVLELGIDVNRQRDLRGDKTVRFNTDRQVGIGLDRMAPDGAFTLEARVSDFHQFPVPVPGLRNARVELLGRIFAGGKAGWSNPVEIVLDGSPPQIERVELRPPVVVIGPKDEEVSVWATDNELSGVAKIEAAFDPLGTGKFGGAAPAVLLDRAAAGYWTTKLPTKTLTPGDITLLVRATDAVGNESDYTKVKCHVITLDQSKAHGTGGTARLMGTVLFGPDPIAAVKLTLAGDPSVKIDPVTSDDHGNFTFPSVPPGKYKLTAAGLIHNKKRKIEQDITIEAGPNPKPVKVVLK